MVVRRGHGRGGIESSSAPFGEPLGDARTEAVGFLLFLLGGIRMARSQLSCGGLLI